jgi:hypothetical protein
VCVECGKGWEGVVLGYGGVLVWGVGRGVGGEGVWVCDGVRV